jgi:hypothetical protein
VRLTHIDGHLPNLALMKLAAYHRERGDEIHFKTRVRRDMFEPDYDRVYASTIFASSAPRVAILRREFPGAIVGGTGLVNEPGYNWRTVEEELGLDSFERYDYSIYDYQGFTASVGRTQIGCRLRCGFCVVPLKEGAPRTTNTMFDIWRGDPYPRHVHLLDNDLFGQPREQWEARIEEMRMGRFRVSISQGINLRLIGRDHAKAITHIPYYDKTFTKRRLYTAFDNMRDVATFTRGMQHLVDAGVKPRHVEVYMLTGYDPSETWERLLQRYETIVRFGAKPFPMVFERAPRVSGNGLAWHELKAFQRWALRSAKFGIPWTEYRVSVRSSHNDPRRSIPLPIEPQKGSKTSGEAA